MPLIRCCDSAHMCGAAIAGVLLGIGTLARANLLALWPAIPLVALLAIAADGAQARAGAIVYGVGLYLARNLAERTGREGDLVFLEPAQRIPSRALGMVREKAVQVGDPVAPGVLGGRRKHGDDLAAAGDVDAVLTLFDTRGAPVGVHTILSPYQRRTDGSPPRRTASPRVPPRMHRAPVSHTTGSLQRQAGHPARVWVPR